ncbi:HAD family hydrolase [Aerococcus kribbianus]|uniref:HAD family hydrolase n=1 Tax=Aerococcus kribbianus TaxID=2999064 RepID=A0A9X3JG26_9LACT|nr:MULTISPECIES: HAD family hydrolase [unclassified Aerococcus]MCZ0717607.1 HAD family hydrolase [Aerococcus sp. YH-aer221]MCZ0725895.1 HAD family hydrolase [Aerococcus sp. YH-aer222]
MNTIIFDMDGVIVDSEYTYLQSKTKILNQLGYDKDISYQYQFMGTTYQYMWEKMKEELNLEESVDYYINLMNQERQNMINEDGVKAIKGVQTFIAEAYRMGFKLGVASSSPIVEIKRNLTELELINYFDVYVSGEEVNNSKPFPDIYQYAMEKLDKKPYECIAIEDTLNGATSANRADLYCVGFKNPDYPAQDLSLADKVVTSFKDLDLQALKHLNREGRE